MGPSDPQGPSAGGGAPAPSAGGPANAAPGAVAAPSAPEVLAAPAPVAPQVPSNAPNVASPSENPQAFPTAFTQGLPPILNAAAVAGGVGGMAVVAAGAGAMTFRGASLQKARLAAARAEFLAPGSQGGA
ncbi:hypothetical protein [Rhodococcus erythropolis]|uniref:hypothetical protein n=1 Tax=Rhodococcus erythropolis TaxID=1833 RepID=UPI001F340D3A|nr:hypothetical protein [Rhodococcus erythropolis]